MKQTGIGKVIFSSSLGTLIEWYDFYIFGMLAKTISAEFFPEGNDTAALLSTLAFDKKGTDIAVRKAAYRAYRRAKRKAAKTTQGKQKQKGANA